MEELSSELGAKEQQLQGRLHQLQQLHQQVCYTAATKYCVQHDVMHATFMAIVNAFDRLKYFILLSFILLLYLNLASYSYLTLVS